MSRARELIREVARLFAPPRTITVSEWAAKNLFLSPEYSSQPGQFTPFAFQREPMDTFSDPLVQQTVIKGAIQILKTIVNQAAIGWAIDVDPGPILTVNEREDDAQSFCRERIEPMIRDTPCLRKKVAASGGKKGKSSTLTQKYFPGGMLASTFASEAGNLARRSIRYLICEEEDKWKASASGRGDPFGMAWGRMDTFRGKKKALRSSSPSRAGSAIDRAYELSDKRQWLAVCPLCQCEQSMMEKFYTQVRYDESLPTVEEQAATARYYCEGCNQPWDDFVRRAAVEAGRWQAQAKFRGIAGFWISSLYSPWLDLADIVLEYLRKKDNPIEKMQFTNERLAENWVEEGEAVQWEALLKRAEEYPVGTVPRGGLFVVGGGDVQWDRIEGEKVAYGRNRESWSVDYRVFDGDTSQPEVWQRFWSWVHDAVPTAGGSMMPTSRFFLDSGDGGRTHMVYEQVRLQPKHIVAIKGTDRGLMPVGQTSKVDVTINGRKIKSGLGIKLVNASWFKSEIYADLKKGIGLDGKYPAGYIHLPKLGQFYGEEHAKQLCAEQKVTWQEKRTGRTKQEWRKKRSRNEALDCRVYARAAAYDLGMDRFQPHHWAQLEAALQGDLFGFEAQEPAAAPEPRRPAEVVSMPPSPPPPLPSVPAQLLYRARPRTGLRVVGRFSV